MNAAPRRIWRPLRSFLILVCVGGAVLAADNTWLNDLRFDFDAMDWWSNISPVEMSSADIAVAPAPANRNTPEISMSRLLNGLLFSKPSSGWRLQPEKIDVTPAWIEQQSTGSFATVSPHFDYSQPTSSISGFVTRASSTGPIAPNAPTASGNWISNATGIWGSTLNWQGGVIADGAGNTAHFDTIDITTPVTVLLDTSRTIGNLYIGAAFGTDRYTISPTSSTLTFDDNSSSFSVHSILQQTSTSAGDTINVSVLVKNDLDINNLSATNQFTISGNIASSAAFSSGQLLWFNNHDTTSSAAGNILVSGNISDGTTGAQLNLVVVHGGTVTLTGTNTYTGYTEIEGGTLLINGTNSGANSVYVDNGGTLGGHGTIAGDVYTFGGTITGETTTTVGTLTMQGSVILHTGEVEGGTYLANLSGATSDLLKITLNLTLGSDTKLNIVGSADGFTTYTLATFGTLTGTFGTVTGLPANYMLVYNATDIELVPTAIPEPSTWIGGAMALGAAAFAVRRRLRGYWLSVISS